MTLKGPNIPQAYSKKDVNEAFVWLQSQSEALRTKVKNTDDLMAVFFRYKRTGPQFLETLAAQPSITQQLDLGASSSETKFLNSLKHLQTEIEQFAEPTVPAAPSPNAGSTNPRPSAAQSIAMDMKSLEILSAIKQGLNLSSDQEVIRMCLVLGYDKLRQIIP